MSVVSVPGEGSVRRIDPLFRMAVVNGIRAVVETNIRKGIDLDARDERGATLLMLAAGKGHSTICRLLLDAGADPDLRDSEGRDAAAYASANKRNDAFLVIVEKRARRAPAKPTGEPEYVDARDESGGGGFSEPARPSDLGSTGSNHAPLVQEVPADSEPVVVPSSCWEIAAEPERPDQDAGALKAAANESFDISLARARSDGEDWSGTRIDLPVASRESSPSVECLFEPSLRRRIGRLLMQGLQTGMVHPLQISTVAAKFGEPAILERVLSAMLGDLGVDIGEDTPRSWAQIRKPSTAERMMVHDAFDAVVLEVTGGSDELRDLRTDIERWSLLDREDEIIYGRQIQEGFEDALGIASRSETLLARIVEAGELVLAGRSSVSDLIEVEDDSIQPVDDDEESTVADDGAELVVPDMPEPLRRLLDKHERIKAALETVRTARGWIDPVSARHTSALLADYGFAPGFLRSLSALEPGSDREARLLEEYRRAVWRMDYARERMVLSNMKLVIWQARKYRATSHLSLADLVQEGAVGLMKAAVKFDPSRGFKFATYGLWWIRQSITRAIADGDRMIRMPVHVHEHYRKLRRRVAAGEDYASFSVEAVAEDLQIAPRLADSILGAFFDVEVVGDLYDVAAIGGDEACADDPEVILDQKNLRDEIADLLDELDPRQRDVIRRRFGLGDGNEQTLEEIGQLYGVTRERIRQIEAKAIRYLAHPVRARRLEAYLG